MTLTLPSAMVLTVLLLFDTPRPADGVESSGPLLLSEAVRFRLPGVNLSVPSGKQQP